MRSAPAGPPRPDSIKPDRMKVDPMKADPVRLAVRRKKSGLTLIELLITVAVLAVVLALGIPSMREVVVRNRLVGINNDLMTALTLARSEAIRRATWVSVCRSADGANCGGTWSDGWIVFVNADNDGPAVVDADETLLRAFPAPPAGYTVTPNTNFANHVTYDQSGAANNLGTFYVCADNDTATARGSTVSRLRPRVVPGIGQCS